VRCFPSKSYLALVFFPIKECNNAFEGGALYVVDIKGRKPTTRKIQKRKRSEPVPSSNENESRLSFSNAAGRRKEFIEVTTELSNAEDLEKYHFCGWSWMPGRKISTGLLPSRLPSRPAEELSSWTRDHKSLSSRMIGQLEE
jgi:hypothetical protein